MFGDGLKVAPSGQQAGVPGIQAFSNELNSLSSHCSIWTGLFRVTEMTFGCCWEGANNTKYHDIFVKMQKKRY